MNSPDHSLPRAISPVLDLCEQIENLFVDCPSSLTTFLVDSGSSTSFIPRRPIGPLNTCSCACFLHASSFVHLQNCHWRPLASVIFHCDCIPCVCECAAPRPNWPVDVVRPLSHTSTSEEFTSSSETVPAVDSRSQSPIPVAGPSDSHNLPIGLENAASGSNQIESFQSFGVSPLEFSNALANARRPNTLDHSESGPILPGFVHYPDDSAFFFADEADQILRNIEYLRSIGFISDWFILRCGHLAPFHHETLVCLTTLFLLFILWDPAYPSELWTVTYLSLTYLTLLQMTYPWDSLLRNRTYPIPLFSGLPDIPFSARGKICLKPIFSRSLLYRLPRR